MSRDRLSIFARHPAAGTVKPHLTPPLPPAEAAAVHRACLHDIVTLAARERGRIELCYEGGADADRYFGDWFPHLPSTVQAQGPVGERLRAAFARSFGAGAERVILLRTESATLPPGALTAGFDDLHDVDLAVGPTRDGRFYLIGLRAAAWPEAARLFRDMPWATGAAVRGMLARASAAGLDTRVLPGWYDIERPGDLARARSDVGRASNLGRWLAGPAGRRYIGPE